jgi:cation transport ATPase
VEPTTRPIHVLPDAGPRLAAEAGPSTHDHEEDEHPVNRGDLVRIGLVALAVAVSWFFRWEPFLKINVVALTTTLVGGYPIYKEAFEALRERRMTMELSMTIALVAALSIRAERSDVSAKFGPIDFRDHTATSRWPRASFSRS